MSATDPKLVQSFKPVLLESFKNYQTTLIKKKDFFNLPLLLGIKNCLLTNQSSSNKSDIIMEDLVNILSQTTDNQTIKLLKEEINFHFAQDKPLLAKEGGSLSDKVRLSNRDWCQEVYMKAVERAAAMDQVKHSAALASS